jgi:hypothetical protein
MEEKCPESFTVFNKEKRAITVTLYELCTVLRVGENGGCKDRTRPMATKLNVEHKTFKVLIENVWGAKSMPSLSLVKNIQDGSAGFRDETLNGFGWADAKARGVGLLAFFCTLSQEQRKVLEDENKKMRWSLNPKTKEKELVSRKLAVQRQPVEHEDTWTGATQELPRHTAYMRQRVVHEDPLTGATETIRKGAAYGRQLVDYEDPLTGATETIRRYVAYGRQLVDYEDPLTGATETIRRYVAYARQLVPFQNQLIRRSAKNYIINREKKGNWCPCGDKCPSCDIQTSRFWITLPKAKDYFVQTGDDCGYELADEDVVDYWCKIAPKLSKEMFRANDANERAVCKYCFRFAIKRFSEELDATTIFVPR